MDPRGRELMQCGDGSVAVLDANFRIYPQGVRFRRATRDAEDSADLVVGLSLAEPEEDVGFAMRQVPTAVVAKPLVEKLFVRKPVCVRDGSGMEAALRVGDVRENQIQNGAVTLGKIRAVPVEADEEKCSRPFIIIQHS